MCLTSCVGKNDENSGVPEALLKKKGLSEDSKAIICLCSWIGVLSLAIILALGLVMWAGITKAGFNPEWTRWLTLSVGIAIGLPAFGILGIMALIANPQPDRGYHSYSPYRPYSPYNDNGW